jgi:hypothetical protein
MNFVCLFALFSRSRFFGVHLHFCLRLKQNRIRVEESGNLIITKLAASDQGRYVCVAQNTVGIRETSAVLLTVNGKRFEHKVHF